MIAASSSVRWSSSSRKRNRIRERFASDDERHDANAVDRGRDRGVDVAGRREADVSS